MSIVKLVIGLLALLLGVRQFRGRPHGDEQPETPKWMHALDQFTAVRAASVGFALSAINPKNLLLAVAGAVAIAQTGIDAGEQAIAYAVFVVIASIGVATPVVLALVLGERSREPLDRLKDWMASNNAVIIAVVLVVLGAKLIGDAISGF